MSIWRLGYRGPKGDQGIQGPIGPAGPSGISKRIVTEQGITNASGTFSVTFTPAFSVTPNISAQMLPAPNSETFIRVSAVSATGCTVHCFSRSGLTVLGISLLSLATTNVASVPVSVTAFEK